MWVVSRRIVPELEASSPVSMVRLKDTLNEYHQKRADMHGYIYYILRKHAWSMPDGSHMYEAKSLATGAICSLFSEYVEEADG
jgi:hypothetical protein